MKPKSYFKEGMRITDELINDINVINVIKQAFSQARQKISPAAN